MKKNAPIYLTLKRMDDSHIVAAMFFDDYVNLSEGNIHKLLKEVASRYQKITEKYKLNKPKELENVIKDFHNYQRWLATHSPPLVVINLKNMICEDLGIDRNTLEAHLLLYEANKHGVRKSSKPVREAVLSTLKSSRNPLSIKDIAIKTGINYNTLRRTLREMTKEGLIKKFGRGFYHV